jgi:restriction system protein
MPIPTFDEMLRPILAFAVDNDATRRGVEAAMAQHFKLSGEERSIRIPSGSSTVVRNRGGWAMTFLTKAGLISKTAPKTYRATDAGREFLKTHPNEISTRDLKALPGWDDAWKSRKSDAGVDPAGVTDFSGATPLEQVDSAMRTIKNELRSQLLEAILKQSPTFFENLVLDVILAMGYGGSREDAAQHLGRSNDEGIDGRINQDPLGLDQIMVQAKRYSPDHVIDRKTIQAFMGSLAGQGVSKGIFITTSGFAESARDFVLRGSNTKIVLMDGDDLLDLMMRHHIGVRVERSLEVPALDQNYFEDSE